MTFAAKRQTTSLWQALAEYVWYPSFSDKESNMKFNLARESRSLAIHNRSGILVTALFICACSSGHGTLTITWTIASTSDATLCDKYDASNVAILVNETSGNPYSRVNPACGTLSTTYFNVPDNTYSVTAQMINDSGNTVSNYIGPIVVSVTSGNTTVQNFDFPLVSFNVDATSGTLAVSWTIASSSTEPQCSSYGAVYFSVTLFDGNGNQYGPTTSVACAAATINIPNLLPGSYAIVGQMLDAKGQPVSSAARATNVAVSAQKTTQQSFDFPAAAFASSNGAVDSGS